MGIGIALLSGTAVASADTNSAGGDTGSSASSDASDAGKGTAAVSSDSGDADASLTEAPDSDEPTKDQPSNKQDDVGVVGSDDDGRESPLLEEAVAEAEITQLAVGDTEGSEGNPVANPVANDAPGDVTEPSAGPEIEPIGTGREDGGSSPRAGPLSLVAEGPAGQNSRAVAAAQEAEGDDSWWDNFVREIQYTFFNKAPTLSPTDAVESEPGVITGQLNGKSNNGFALSYAIKTAPKAGTLTIDQEAGTYTYTYDPSKFTADTKDAFVIVADNGSEARKTGLLGIVQLVMHNVAISLGLAQRDTAESNFLVTGKKIETPDEKIEVTIRGTGFYGDRSNSRYWAHQNYADNCLLMSTLMIEGQFSGVVPTRAAEEAIVEQAKETPSVVDPSKPMYLGDDSENGVRYKDAAELIEIRGNVAYLRSFPEDEDKDSTYDDGLEALDYVSKLLLGGNGVMVGVNNDTIWDATEKEGTPGADRITSNHGVVVIAVDTHNGKVYINDPGVTGGMGLAVPLGAFMWAWESSNFLTLAVINPAAESPVASQSNELVLAG